MASFTDVGDTTSITLAAANEEFLVSLSGTYSMVIKLQRAAAPGGLAWIDVKTYTGVNTTFADYFTSKCKDDTYRLIVVTDTSGTCVATLTEVSDLSLNAVRDVGSDRAVAEFKQSGLYVDGAVKPDVVSLTSATYTLTAAEHANRRLLLDASGGIDVTMPAATGTGDTYEFWVVTATADLYAIISAGSDKVYGCIAGADDPGDEFVWAAVPGTDNRVKLGGTTQASGGSIGDYIRFTDIGAAKWAVDGHITHGGTEATPFAAS